MAVAIFCNENLRSPLADDPTTATLYISSIPGQSELYYSPPQKISDTVYKLLLVLRFYQAHSFDDLFPGQEVVGLPHAYRTTLQPAQLKCNERKMEMPKLEYFDADNNLMSLVAAVPVQTIDLKEGSPLDMLFRKLCDINSKNVAGKYEGVNYTTYKTGGEGDQKISISVEQTGNQLEVSFQTPGGGQGEGTGILEGNALKTISLKSTTPNCPGSYQGSLEFNDDGSVNWSFKGQDCSGPVEGHGNAKKPNG